MYFNPAARHLACSRLSVIRVAMPNSVLPRKNSTGTSVVFLRFFIQTDRKCYLLWWLQSCYLTLTIVKEWSSFLVLVENLCSGHFFRNRFIAWRPLAAVLSVLRKLNDELISMFFSNLSHPAEIGTSQNVTFLPILLGFQRLYISLHNLF